MGRPLVLGLAAGLFGLSSTLSCDSIDCGIGLPSSQYAEFAFPSWHAIENERDATGAPDENYALIPTPFRNSERILLLYDGKLSGNVAPILRSSQGTEVGIGLGYDRSIGFDVTDIVIVSIARFNLEGESQRIFCLDDVLTELASLGVESNGILEVRNYGPGDLEIDSVGN